MIMKIHTIYLTKFYELCGTLNDRSGSANCVHEIASSFIYTKQKIASSFIHRLHRLHLKGSFSTYYYRTTSSQRPKKDLQCSPTESMKLFVKHGTSSEKALDSTS